MLRPAGGGGGKESTSGENEVVEGSGRVVEDVEIPC